MDDLEQKQQANPPTEGPQAEAPEAAAPPAEIAPAAGVATAEASAPAAAPTDGSQAMPAAPAAETGNAAGAGAASPVGTPESAPATAADEPASGAPPAAALPAEDELQVRQSRVPAILLAVAVAIVGGTVALAAVQKSMRSSLFVVTERAAIPGTVEKYGEAPEMWRVYPELRTKWSCRLHGGTWVSQTWKDAAGKQSSRSLCLAQ